jgi:hypothetical protein
MSETTTHVADCRWERTTAVECEYKETHHYCPHPEHACSCPQSDPPADHRCTDLCSDVWPLRCVRPSGHVGRHEAFRESDGAAVLWHPADAAVRGAESEDADVRLLRHVAENWRPQGAWFIEECEVPERLRAIADRLCASPDTDTREEER